MGVCDPPSPTHVCRTAMPTRKSPVCGAVVLALALLVGLVEAQRPQAFKSEGEVLYVTPTLMAGALFGLLWLCIFFAGFCCLFSLQTPAFFADKPLTMHKNY